MREFFADNSENLDLFVTDYVDRRLALEVVGLSE